MPTPTLKDAAQKFAIALVPDVAIDTIRRTRLATTEQGRVRSEQLDGPLPTHTLPAIPAKAVDPTEGADFDNLEDQVAAMGNGLTVQEQDADVATGVTTLDFDGSDFNTSDEGSGEVRVGLNYGTGAGQPAEGNHTHTNDHVPVTVVDGTGIDFTLTGQQITAEPKFAGSGSAGTVAHSDHNHSGTYANASHTHTQADSHNSPDTDVGTSSLHHTLGTGANQAAAGNHGHSGVVIGMSVNVGNGSSVVTSSEPFVLVRVPVAATITGNYVNADAVGSITFGISKASSGSPTSFSSIVASAPPTLSSAQSSSDTTLTGWTTSLSAGDWLKITVTGTPSTVKRVGLSLAMTRSL